jgi:phosphopantothenoylcysteine decarboxylase / phosphopantothenate---cysteine ligase
MRILITAGPTREPIDPVRYIGNRSSGKMGAALARAAVKVGHQVSVILGPVEVSYPDGARRVDVETAGQMFDAVMREFPGHDLLFMAAAVADYRPVSASAVKLSRGGAMTLALEPTEDIVAAAGGIKRADQRTVGFSLETTPDMGRVLSKLRQKKLDLIVYNPAKTIASELIEPTLIYADGREGKLASRPKGEFADILIQRAAELF